MEIDFYYQALFHFYKGTVPCQCQCDEISLISKTEYQTGYFAFKTELTKDWEITMLSLLITLTPGTLVMDISDDRTILYIHAMDIEDAEKAIFDIRESFEKAIQEVSR